MNWQTPTELKSSMHRIDFTGVSLTNPNELDLMNCKKMSHPPSNPMSADIPEISSRIQRLVTMFDSLCPNVYRVHGSDSLRILKEIVCLADYYLRVQPSMIVSPAELFDNEKHLNDYITKLRISSVHPLNSWFSLKSDLRCFGQGIQSCNYYNELNQTLVFCFEVKINSSDNDPRSLPFQIHIVDPRGYPVPSSVNYINTYSHTPTRLYSCSYTPITQAGIYKISFLYKNIKTVHPPYTVSIRESSSNKFLHTNQEVIRNKSIQQGKRKRK